MATKKPRTTPRKRTVKSKKVVGLVDEAQVLVDKYKSLIQQMESIQFQIGLLQQGYQEQKGTLTGVARSIALLSGVTLEEGHFEFDGTSFQRLGDEPKDRLQLSLHDDLRDKPKDPNG